MQPPVAFMHLAPPAAPRPTTVPPNADELGAHRLRLGHLAEGLALRMGWDAEPARLLRLAAPLHDAGASHGEDGADALHSQPRRGAALLGGSRLPLFALAAQIALHHRERWDGNGYPQGLRGEAIPLGARIVAVVDFFDALTAPRSYRPARADDRALAMLAEQAGAAFDPEVVDAFIAHAPELIALRNEVNAALRPTLA